MGSSQRMVLRSRHPIWRMCISAILPQEWMSILFKPFAMFWEIFRFEVQSRLRRPAIYLYMAAELIFTGFSFATGSLPLGEKQHINSPTVIGFWSAGMSMVMMLVGSAIMGMPLYRDIEFGTKDYYLTYPITRR